MDQDGSLLESGLLVGGGHLVAHPQLHLGRAHLEAGDDDKKTKRQKDKKTKRQAHLEAGDSGSVVGQSSSCQQAGSCNSLVLNFNWNMKMR